MIIPTGGTGPGQETETGDTALPLMTRSPVPTTSHTLLMTGLQLQAGLSPQLTNGHPPPAGLHQLTTGHPHPEELHQPLTCLPQPKLQAELLPPMTGTVSPLSAGARRLIPG